jgi:hypothetical protein
VLTGVENGVNTKGTGVNIGSDLREYNRPMYYVLWCIMICWVDTPSAPPFID